MKVYNIKHQGMISAIGEQQKYFYNTFLDSKMHRWFWPTGIDNPGDYIYVSIPKNESGFGGRIMNFYVTKTIKIDVKGPFQTNSMAFKHASDIDLTEKHLIFGVISINKGPNQMIGVLYEDDVPKIGHFNRILDLSQQMSKERKQILFYYSQSTGGSVVGMTKNDENSNS